MPKYAVRLEGTGCQVRVQKRSVLSGEKSVIEAMGFYTTRFVEAVSPAEAGEKVTAMVRAELTPFLANRPDQIWSSSIDEIWEDPKGFSLYAPGSGFTWYTEDETEEVQNDQLDSSMNSVH